MPDRQDYRDAIRQSLAFGPALEVLDAFEEFLANAHNDGDPVCPSEDDVARAIGKVDSFRKRFGGASQYPGYPADGG